MKFPSVHVLCWILCNITIWEVLSHVKGKVLSFFKLLVISVILA